MIRLVLVEVRRAVNTRAPRWAFATAIALGMLVGFVSPGGIAETFEACVGAVALVLPVLMALLAVMAFTADWTTRAALTTFALTPSRPRVLAARYVAILFLAVVTLAVIHVLAAATFVMIRPAQVESVFDDAVVRQFWQMLATTVAASLTAMAVAGLVLRTALALLVTVLGPLLVTFGLALAPSVLTWLNPYGFASWLAEPTPAWVVTSETHTGLGPAVTSFVVWTAVPLVIGWYRQIRAEPR